MSFCLIYSMCKSRLCFSDQLFSLMCVRVRALLVQNRVLELLLNPLGSALKAAQIPAFFFREGAAALCFRHSTEMPLETN